MTANASELLTYVNLQMVSESTQIPEKHMGSILPEWLVAGNNRSSRTPDSIISELTPNGT